MSEEDDFVRCVAVLADDAERAGKLDWSHVIRVVTARGLGDAISEIVMALRELGVAVDAPFDIASGNSRTTDRDHPTLPASMRIHAILDAESEVLLGRRIQLGLAAADSAARAGLEPGGDACALIADGEEARKTLIVAN